MQFYMSQTFVQGLQFPVATFFVGYWTCNPMCSAMEQCSLFNENQTYTYIPTSSSTKHIDIWIDSNNSAQFFVILISVSTIDRTIFLPQNFSSNIIQQFNKNCLHLSFHMFSKMLNQTKMYISRFPASLWMNVHSRLFCLLGDNIINHRENYKSFIFIYTLNAAKPSNRSFSNDYLK